MMYVGAAPVVTFPIDIPAIAFDEGQPYPLPPVVVEADLPAQMKALILGTFHSLRRGEENENVRKLNNLVIMIAPWPQASASVHNIIAMLYADF